MLELKVGHIYKDRTGDTIIIVAKNGGDNYPFGGFCVETKLMEFYNIDGSYNGLYSTSNYDLIEEIGEFHA